MKLWDEYKDLKIGDFVRFSDHYICDGKVISGEGEVFGFGRFDHTDLVWIRTEEGSYEAVPYGKVEKI